MLRITMAFTIALLTALVGSLEAQSIQGIWRLTGGETMGGPNEGMVEFQGGLLAYGDTHFLWALDINEDPRPMPDQDASDSDIAEAIQGFTAVAGTYELDGETISYFWDTSVNPSLASQNQPQVREILTLTEDRLVTGVTNDEGVTTTLIYERVE